MYNAQAIANTIRNIAKSQNVTIKNMLKDLDLGVNAISRISKGQALSSINLARIADYLGCSVDYLLGRTNDPKLHIFNNLIESTADKNIGVPQPAVEQIMRQQYLLSATNDTETYLLNIAPEWVNVPKTDKTLAADFMIRISGESMLPKFRDGDTLLIKKSLSIFEGEIGIFSVDGELFIKEMGNGRLISLNNDYDNILLSEHDSVYCFGLVIGILNE